jgi:hypothetical protein
MLEQPCVKVLSQEEPAAVAEPEPSSQMLTLAQLVHQIDDALLIVEHPQLAACVYAALRPVKAA